MKGQPPKGIEALLLAPTPSVPSVRSLVSRRLADHIHGFLLWMQHARARSENTVKAYGNDVRMFVAFCEKSGITDTEQVTFHRVEAFGAVQRAHLGLSEVTVARRRSALGQFFLYLERYDLVPKNPAKLAIGMKLPPRRPPDYMTREERERILAVLANRLSPRGRRNYALFALMFLTGLRVSEVCHLTVEDVALDAAMLYVRNGKGRKDRRVPMTPRLIRILRLWLAIRAGLVGSASPWFFLHMWGHHKYGDRPLHQHAVWAQVQKRLFQSSAGRSRRIRFGIPTSRTSGRRATTYASPSTWPATRISAPRRRIATSRPGKNGSAWQSTWASRAARARGT